MERIIRGQPAPPDRYPYMVRLTNRNLLFCGGTVRVHVHTNVYCMYITYSILYSHIHTRAFSL